MKKILVLDDELEVDFVFKAMFEDEINAKKLCIDFTANPKNAIDNYLKKNLIYDYILCDINMPLMNGVQFVKEMRDKKYSGQIAFMSAYAKEEYSTVMEECHVNYFIEKPINFGEVKKLLKLS
jgi:two-component system response regulator YesN